MPEIFKFTQLREPTGINIEEVRQEHIQFFNKIESVEEMGINQAFLKDFESGIEAIEIYLSTNKGFLDRSFLPNAVIKNDWTYKGLNGSHRIYFELSYLLSQYNSDKKESKNEALFSQIFKKASEIDEKDIKDELDNFKAYFEDLLVLYFKSNAYPSFLRLLIGLRRWHFVLSIFSLSDIQKSFKDVPGTKDKIEVNTVLHFLFNARILLPKYLFIKRKKEKPKDSSGPTDVILDNPKVVPPIDIILDDGKIGNVKEVSASKAKTKKTATKPNKKK